jgi:hypothetical protein
MVDVCIQNRIRTAARAEASAAAAAVAAAFQCEQARSSRFERSNFSALLVNLMILRL